MEQARRLFRAVSPGDDTDCDSGYGGEDAGGVVVRELRTVIEKDSVCDGMCSGLSRKGKGVFY
jgi:hypothetical protein